jgi:Plavaka transposase
MDVDDDDEVPKAIIPKQDIVIPSTSCGRRRRFPGHFIDYLPSLSVHLPHTPERPHQQMQPKGPDSNQRSQSPSPSRSPTPPAADGAVPTFDTEPDEFGLFRSYISCPTYEPDEEISLDSVCDADGFSVVKANSNNWSSMFGPYSPSAGSIGKNPFAPFLNATVFHLMSWFYGGSNMKSVTELDKLVNDVILDEDFDKAHLKGFNATRELKRVDEYEQDKELPAKDGWKETSVKISLPAERAHNDSEEDAPTFKVNGVFYRPLTDVIVSAFQEAAVQSFHLTPFRLFWKRSEDAPAERVISELYNSDAMIMEHQKILAQPREPDCSLEIVVGALMLWSDSTHLATFGNASLWPIYMYFGNQSKYTRGKLTSFSAHHIVYIPSVSDVKDCHIFITNCSLNSSQISFKISTSQYLTSVHQPVSSHTSSANLCMQSGWSYSTQALSMHMSMGSSFGLLTEFQEEFFQDFLHIRLIIPKSEK